MRLESDEVVITMKVETADAKKAISDLAAKMKGLKSTIAKATASPTADGAWARGWRSYMDVVSKLRAIIYPLRVLGDVLRFVANIMRGVIRAFEWLARTWIGIVSTALKLGTAIGVGVVGALGLASKAAVTFETAMLRVGGVLNKNLSQMGYLERSIRNVAKATTVAPAEIAQGAFQLASYGFGQKQTAAMLPGVTALAMASSAERGETGGIGGSERAAETIGRIIMVWRKSGREAMDIANTLAAANAKSAATFERLFDSMPKAAQAASLVKLSFEELVATLSQLYNAGMSGEQAGAALLAVIQRLLAPTEQFKKVVESHGIAFEKVNPAIVGFRQALVNLVKLGLDPTEIATFRNRNGMIALNILLKQGVAMHDEMTRAITGTNQAQTQAARMVSGVQGRYAFLKSSLVEFAITLTEKVRPALAWFLNQLGLWVNWLSQTPMVQKFANALGALASVLARMVIDLLPKGTDAWNLFSLAMNALVGYMRTAANVVVIALGLIEYAFRSIADESSPLRKLWSSFWDFVVDSVQFAGGILVGALSALQRFISNIFHSVSSDAKLFGSQFMAIAAEIVRSTAALPLRIKETLSRSTSDETYRRIVELRKKRERKGFTPREQWEYLKLGAEYKSQMATADQYGEQARNIEQLDLSSILQRVEGRIQGALGTLYAAATKSGGPLEGVAESFGAARSGWVDRIQKLRSGQLGGNGLPVTSRVAGGLNSGINAFVDALSRAVTQQRAIEEMGGEGMMGKLPGDLTDAMEDNSDNVEGNTQELQRFNDKIDGLITKVIGAPLEALQRYLSPVSLAGAGFGSGGLGPLIGMPGGPMPSARYQVFNFDFGNGVKESFRYELTRGGGARLMDHKITRAFEQAMPALQGR